MGDVVVGIGEYKICQEPGAVLKTYGLGSCVAVAMYDRRKKIAGMLHVAYPDSAGSTKKVKEQPAYFADTGIPLFLSAMKNLDVQKKDVWIAIAGGSSIMDETERFKIGKRNVLAVKKVLWNAGLGVLKEDIGGSEYRTMFISASTGDITISNAKNSWHL